MDSTSDRIKKRRTELGLTLDDVAEALGVNKSTVLRYETKEIEKLPINVIDPLSKILKVSREYLMGWDQNSDTNIYSSSGVDFIRVPLYAPLCCGSGLFVDDQIEQMVAVPSDGLHRSSNDYFAQTASGDSMIDAGIYPGDLLIFEKNPDLVDGMIGCFCVDENEAVCKKFKRSHDGLIILQPANSKYDSIVITPDSHFVCVGRLRKSIRSFNWD